MENYYKIIIKKGEINLGENYVFNLKRLSVITNTIKWTGLNKDTVLNFNYTKIYKEPDNIIEEGIVGLGAGEPYDNIINNGTAIINLTINICRGLDLF